MVYSVCFLLKNNRWKGDFFFEQIVMYSYFTVGIILVCRSFHHGKPDTEGEYVTVVLCLKKNKEGCLAISLNVDRDFFGGLSFGGKPIFE